MATTISPVTGPPQRLEVELLALDLGACGRCTGTRTNVRAVLALARDLWHEVGTDLVYRETIVGTADEAERLRFASSPSVRINGRDIAAEFRESSCADCGELCGCNGSVNCRIWVWQGKEYSEAPRGLLLDALFRAYGEPGPAADAASAPFRLPENLRTFFAARDKQKQRESTCCDESACCEPADKAACCGKPVEGQPSGTPACGCQ